MNESLKQSLVEQFRAHLETLDDDTELEMMADADAIADADADTGTDLHSLYIEMAALRSEVRTESRLVKDTLDLVRDVVGRAETERARVAELEREAALLKPLLIDLIEVRDRLAAGGRPIANSGGAVTMVPACAVPTRPPTPGGKGCG